MEARRVGEMTGLLLRMMFMFMEDSWETGFWGKYTIHIFHCLQHAISGIESSFLFFWIVNLIINIFILLNWALWLSAAGSLSVTKGSHSSIISIAGDIWGYPVDCTRIQILSFHRQENLYFLKARTGPTLDQPRQERQCYLVSVLCTAAVRHQVCNSALAQHLGRERHYFQPSG